MCLIGNHLLITCSYSYCTTDVCCPILPIIYQNIVFLILVSFIFCDILYSITENVVLSQLITCKLYGKNLINPILPRYYFSHKPSQEPKPTWVGLPYHWGYQVRQKPTHHLSLTGPPLSRLFLPLVLTSLTCTVQSSQFAPCSLTIQGFASAVCSTGMAFLCALNEPYSSFILLISPPL